LRRSEPRHCGRCCHVKHAPYSPRALATFLVAPFPAPRARVRPHRVTEGAVACSHDRHASASLVVHRHDTIASSSSPFLGAPLAEAPAHTAHRGLTPRSKGAPTARHQGPATGTLYIVCGRALASRRRRPLTSNVRPLNPPCPLTHPPSFIARTATQRSRPEYLEKGSTPHTKTRSQASISL
jgi:hypothetical protein